MKPSFCAALLAIVATLLVPEKAAAQGPLTFSATATPNPAAPGGVSRLTITIANRNAAPSTGVAFSLPLPTGVTVASPPNEVTTCPVGSITAVAGGNSVSFSGGTVPANTPCTVSVDVVGATTGNYTIRTDSVTAAEGDCGQAETLLRVTTANALFGSALNTTIDGTEVTFDIYLENVGPETLEDLSVKQDLDAVLGPDNHYFVSPPVLIVDPGTFALNPDFDRYDDRELILQKTPNGREQTGPTLAPGATAQIRFTVGVVNVGAALGSYQSQVATFATAGGFATTDLSDDGTDPNPGGGAGANGSGEDDPTAISIPVNESLGVATYYDLSGGNIRIFWVLENLGDTVLTNVALSNNYNAVFGAGNYTHIADPRVIENGSGLRPNNAFNGNTNTTVLNSGSTLAPGERAVVRAVLRLDFATDQGFGPGIYQNQVTATAEGALGAVSDLSDFGTVTDPNMNGDAGDAGEDDPTVIDVNSRLGLALDVTPGAGTVTFDYYLEVFGSIPVGDLSLVENYATLFGEGNFSLASVSLIDDPGTITLNPGFDGADERELLGGGSSLAGGDTAQIRVVVNVLRVENQGSGFGNYSTSSRITGTGPNGVPYSANSASGTDPSGTSGSSPFSLATDSLVGAAHDASVAGNVVTFDYFLENFGTGTASDVGLVHELDTIFGSGNYAITTPPFLVADPGTLVLNGSFDGVSNTELLGAGSTLAGGATAQLRMVVTVDKTFDQYGGGPGVYRSQVEVSATDPLGAPLGDLSDSGSDSDPNGNGDPTEAGENDPSPFLIGTEGIGIAMRADLVGTQVFYTYTLQNLGTLPLQNVLLTNPLNPVFGSGNYSIVSQPSLLEGPPTLLLSPQYFGFSIFDRLVLGGSLPGGATVRFRVVVNVNNVTDVSNGFGVYQNQVTVTAQGLSGTNHSDVSDEGLLPDSNNNDRADDAGEGDPTGIIIGDEARIGIAESAAVNGSEVTLDLHLENLGGSALSSVFLDKNLDEIFGAGNHSLAAAPAFIDDPGTLVLNGSFDGSGDPTIFSGGSLAAGDTAQVRLVVDVTNLSDRGLGYGVYSSQSTATATAPLGTVAFDLSDAGTDPDPNGNGIAFEGGENDPLVFSLPISQLGVALDASVAGNIVTFTYTLKNLGDDTITDVGLPHNLDDVFGAGNYVVTGGPRFPGLFRDLLLNPSFDGSTDTRVILGGSLAPGVTEVIELVVGINNAIDAGSGPGVYSTQVTLTGNDSAGSLNDLSDAGTNPDPGGNGIADDAGEDDPTGFTLPVETPSLIVTTTADVVSNIDGETSLREAINFANSNAGDDEITFDAGVFNSRKVILIGESELAIDSNITITAPAAGVIVDGQNAVRLFHISNSGTAEMIGLTLQNGFNDIFDASNPGGAITNRGSLILRDSLITGCSTISGSAIIASSGTAALANCTLSGNSANGGILRLADGSALVTNCTFVGNTGVNGDIRTDRDTNPTLTLNNSIVPVVAALSGSSISGSNNVIQTLFQEGSGSLANTFTANPQLAALADNGGLTLTHALLPGSPAIDAGSNALALDASSSPLTTDQRGTGFPRVVKGYASAASAIVDIGAFEVATIPIDFGDAPDLTGGPTTGNPYPTLLEHNGARHVLAGAFLGASVDDDDNGQPSPTASGDDSDGNDDEDGVVFTSALVTGSTSSVDVTLSNPDPSSNLLDAWIDFNGDGDWDDAGEQIFNSFDLGTTGGTQSLNFPVPATGVVPGDTFARFRLSSAGGLTPRGQAADGEVEDHEVTIAPVADLAITVADSADPVNVGTAFSYSIDVSNAGPSEATNVTVTNTLPPGVGFVSASGTGWTCNESGGVVTCTRPSLAVGAAPTIMINVTAPSTGGVISNNATVGSDVADIVGSNDSGEAQTTVLDVGTIGDFVWNDLDGDGVQDAGEPGISGVTVFLDLNTNSILDAGEPNDTTDASGAYDIGGVVAGSYDVRVDDTTVPTGFVLTGGISPLPVNLAAGEDFNDADFGYQQQNATIGDFVWDDVNGDGVQDAGEPGIPGVTVFIDLNTNSILDAGEPKDTTDANGAYDLTSLATGAYSVAVDETTVPAGYAVTTSNIPLAVNLAAGEDFNDADFGYAEPETPSLVVTIASDTSNDFDGETSLREAIGYANSGSAGASPVITFASPLFDTPRIITLNGSQLPVITHDLAIDGPATDVTISGNSTSRVFQINSGTVSMSRLTITGGNPGVGTGGGVLINGGAVTLTDCTVSANTAGSAGAGITGQTGTGNLTVIRCAIVGNSTVGNVNGGGLQWNSSGTAWIINSTISGNLAGNVGGGIRRFAGSVFAINCTITNNTAGGGSGGGGINGDVTLANTIVAGNTAGSSPDVFGTFTSQGNNLIGDGTGGSGFTNGVIGDQVGSSGSPVDALLGPLADNGGPTQTHALLPGSPAIDAGSNALALDADSNPLVTDQRGVGFPRILDGDPLTTPGATVDIGAYEAPVPVAIVFTKSFDGPTAAGGTAELTFKLENVGAAVGDLSFTDDLNVVLSGLVAVGLPKNDICGTGSTLSGTSLITLTGGSLGVGETKEFSVIVQVPAGTPAGIYPNTTSDLLAAGLPAADPATADLQIEPPPTFAKVFGPDTIYAGETTTLTFTIDNSASAIAATNIDFTDNLPAGMVVANPANVSTTCSSGIITAVPGSGTITYTGGAVAAGAVCTVQVDVTTTTDGFLVNTTGDLTSSSGNSGTATDNLEVLRRADLAVAIDVLQTPLVAGGAAFEIFRVTVTNNGPSAATGVELNQTSGLPPNVLVTAADPSAGSFSAGLWTVGDLANGESASLTLTIRAGTGAASGINVVPLAFEVTAASATAAADPDDSNNAANAAVSIISPADTSTAITVAPTVNLQSGLFVSQVTVTNGNAAPIPAFRLYVKNLPADVTVYNASGSASFGDPPTELPYLLYNQPVAPTASVTLSVEFFRPSLDPDFTPMYEIELLPAPETPPLAADSGIDVTRNERLGNGDHLIEIASIPGATYAVEYSADMASWTRVVPNITAAANRLQWIDNGPPKTESHPATVPKRMYRFVLISTP